MKLVTGLSNGLAITMSMVCMSYLYQRYWRAGSRRRLVATVAILGLTVAMFGVQLAHPESLAMLRRDWGALKDGEWWRAVTPLLVQPYGWWQFFFNLMFLVVFLPIAGRLYGAWVWAMFWVPGLVGQAANYAWMREGGGTSTAAFGLMGALLAYVLTRRAEGPKQSPYLALLGLVGALVMGGNRDGHGAGMLTGAVLGGAWSGWRRA